MRIRTPTELGLIIRQARRQRGMTQQELARAAAVGRQWIVAVEAGKPRVELAKVLQTLAALDLSLAVGGEGAHETARSALQIEKIDLQAVLDAHRRVPP